jgi:hypothetical protein
MFQRKLTTAHSGPARDLSAAGAQDGLRPITWPELRAQLDAARAFRSALGGGEGALKASFAPGSADRVAALGNSERAVNFVDSADGKPATAISRSPSKGAVRDDRESK